ncbi:ribonuclease Z [Candidatus Woesearchaeota archaeon]|nr:ribonuclease Z [Candidatus Woesearchaeota archaeon]
MMEITFLGTGCMAPTKQRNHSGMVWQYKDEYLLLDCGEGTQRQMRLAGIKPAKITRLLISHWHGDHVFGIPGLMSTMGADQFASKLRIYGPPGTKEYFQHIFKWFSSKDIIEHEVYEVNAGKVFETDDFEVLCAPLKHSAACVGYALVEKDTRRILMEKVKKLGIPEGPLIGKLQEGKTIEHKGKKIHPDDVSVVVKGKKISYVADTRPCDGANLLASEADLLIAEGTHLSDIEEKTRQFMHLTVKETAQIASENGAKKLIVTHISQRYKSSAEIVKEARDYFDNTIVAEDLMKVKV